MTQSPYEPQNDKNIPVNLDGTHSNAVWVASMLLFLLFGFTLFINSNPLLYGVFFVSHTEVPGIAHLRIAYVISVLIGIGGLIAAYLLFRLSRRAPYVWLALLMLLVFKYVHKYVIIGLMSEFHGIIRWNIFLVADLVIIFATFYTWYMKRQGRFS